MNPDVQESTWVGTIELQIGDLGECQAYAELCYSYDGSTYRLGAHKIIAEIEGYNIDVSKRITDFAVEDIFEQYIVKSGHQ